MTRTVFTLSIVSLGVLALGGALSPASAADVRIGVHVGAPPVVIAPPAPVVVSPGVPIYYYGANYYTFHNGAWFVTPTYGHPWAYVPRPRVPHAIVGVPGAYYRIPHHHASRFAGPHPWAHERRHGRGHGHGHKHGHGHGHDHGHGRGHR